MRAWRTFIGCLTRFTGPLLIVMISASCGFTLGIAACTTPSPLFP
ncbi:hypothetical protein [Streptomyces sp. IBSBF 2806]